MKLLLDECAPKRLRNDFPGHEIWTVEEVGLKGLKNGDLLRAAAEQCDVVITLKLLVPRALEYLETIKAGDVVIIQ